MLHKRDFATNICVAMQNQMGKEFAGVYNIEDFEERNENEFKDYVLNQYHEYHYKAMIFTGWAFTKELYYKMRDFVLRQLKDDDFSYCIPIFIPELITFILFVNNEAVKQGMKLLNKEIIEVSDLNIKDIEESDNAIQINYFTKSVVKYFEEKPKAIEKIIEGE